jgi:hypothetical protein
VIDEKKPQGRKRTYATPKGEVAQAIGVSTGTLVNAEQHVAAMERYPILGGPEVSQKQALELAKVLDGLPEDKERHTASWQYALHPWWPNARRNPVGPPPKMQKIPAISCILKSLWDAHARDLLHVWRGVPHTTLWLLAAAKQRLHVPVVLP